MTTSANPNTTTAAAGSYASHFEIALSNWHLLQMEQIKKRPKPHKPKHEVSATRL